MDQVIQTFEHLALGVLDAPWARFLYGVRWLFIFLDIAVIVAFVILFVKALNYRPKFTRSHKKAGGKSPFDTKLFSERWAKLEKHALSAPPQSCVLAIIEADKLVDDALRLMGLEGEHMADRLQKLRVEDYPSLDRLWRAHRVRNELVHTPDFGIDEGDAKDVLKAYQKFLKELGALTE
ncbi:MAG: hypothetical protein V1885_03360 [Candidatus Brennerbacteria bacterium]